MVENKALVFLLSLHLITILILYLFSTLYTGASNGPKAMIGISLYSPETSSLNFFERSSHALSNSFSFADDSVIRAISQNGARGGKGQQVVESLPDYGGVSV